MTRRILFFFLVLLISLAIACQKSSETQTASTDTSTTTSTASTSTSATTSSQPPAAQNNTISEGMQHPESVLYDPDQDVYFISNINGDPAAADDNGFISRVKADSLQVEAKWIDGAKPDITLNAPKGMAIVGDDLYVADLTTVRKFDRKTGAVKGEIPLAGTNFLNDVATDGKDVYVSDTGVKGGPNGSMVPAGSDAVWKISGNSGTKIASGADLKGPNGVAIVNGKVWVVTFGGNELYPIENGKKGKATTMPKGMLDGLVPMSDGSMLVTSWEGKAVYRGTPGGTFTPVLENQTSPADIGYDAKRHRLLIPHLMEDKVTIHDLQ